MKTEPLEANESDFWCVRFEALEGGYHPIWFGQTGGPKISRDEVELMANRYLNEHLWLRRIDDIYVPKS